MNKFLSLLLLAGLATAANAATGDIQYCNIESDGWIAQVYVTGLTTGGTYNYGLGQSNSPSSSANFIITVSSPGYDDSGASNGLVRQIYGVLRLRKPYNNQTQADERVVNTSDVITRVVLSDRICANDTLISCVIGSGFYNDGSHNNNAANFTPTGCTNLSTLLPPRVLGMWSQPGNFLVGSSYTVSAVAFHYSARQGRPVRAMEFWGKDSAGHTSPHVFVLNPTIDRTQPDANPVIEYIATIDGSGFDQGSTISNYWKAYPWYGPALDCSDGVNAPGSPDYCPQLAYCNKTGGWPLVYALVDPAGNNATAKCVTNLTQWTDGTAKPFATIADAINAAGSTNNTINGSNTLSGVYVGLTNGSYAIWGGPNISALNAGTTWITVQARPDLTSWTNVVITNANNNLTMDKKNRLRVYHLHCAVTNNNNTFSAGYAEVLIDNCLVNTNLNAVNLVSSHTNCWLKQCIMWGQRQMSNPSANQANSQTRMRGCTVFNFDGVDGRTTPMDYTLALGNNFPCTGSEQYGFVNDSIQLVDPGIWAYNTMYRQSGLQYPISMGIITNILKGFALVQNVLESTANVSASVPLDVMFSARENELITNWLSWNNTILGAYHPPFVLVAGTNISEEWYQDLNNLYGGLQSKADVEQSSAALTNRWCDVFSVGRQGNANANYLQTGTNPGGVEKGFDGISSWFFSATNAQAFLFVDNEGHSTVGGGGNGLGNYRLLTENPMRGLRLRVVVPYDIAGNPRGEFDPPGAYVAGNPRRGGAFFAN